MNLKFSYPLITAEPEVFARIKECEKLIEDNLLLRDSWVMCFETLTRLGRNEKGIGVLMWTDFAPFSFMWKAAGLTGGLIFHGSFDGYGSGSGPTYSVCIEKTTGWALHS